MTQFVHEGSSRTLLFSCRCQCSPRTVCQQSRQVCLLSLSVLSSALVVRMKAPDYCRFSGRTGRYGGCVDTLSADIQCSQLVCASVCLTHRSTGSGNGSGSGSDGRVDIPLNSSIVSCSTGHGQVVGIRVDHAATQRCISGLLGCARVGTSSKDAGTRLTDGSRDDVRRR